MVKYPHWIQKLFYYTIQHEGGRHIDFRQCLYLRGRLRPTTARRLSAYMSSIALATTTAFGLYFSYGLSSEINMDGWMD